MPKIDNSHFEVDTHSWNQHCPRSWTYPSPHVHVLVSCSNSLCHSSHTPQELFISFLSPWVIIFSRNNTVCFSLLLFKRQIIQVKSILSIIILRFLNVYVWTNSSYFPCLVLYHCMNMPRCTYHSPADWRLDFSKVWLLHMNTLCHIQFW